MPDLLIHAKGPAIRASVIIACGILMIMIRLSVLPFWSRTSVMLIDSVALTVGLLGGLFQVFDIMPATVGIEVIAWRNKHPEEYEEEA